MQEKSEFKSFDDTAKEIENYGIYYGQNVISKNMIIVDRMIDLRYDNA